MMQYLVVTKSIQMHLRLWPFVVITTLMALDMLAGAGIWMSIFRQRLYKGNVLRNIQKT